MQVKAFTSKRPRIEMVPLIDMFFLLLVFFIFAVFSMTMQQGLLVDLPAAATAEASREETVTISVSADGIIALDREPVTLETLREALAAARGRLAREPVVLINADRAVPHGTVVEVLDRVRQAELHRVSFQTEMLDDGS